MSDEAQTTPATPTQATTAPATEPTQAAEPAAPITNGHDPIAATPPGFEPVEFTPEQKARVDRLYGNMKRYEKTAKEMEQANQILVGQLQNLAQGQQQIVSHLQVNDFQDAENKLSTEARTAYQNGDLEGFLSAQNKLTDIRVKRGIAEASVQKQPQNQPVQQQNRVPVQDAVNMAVENGTILPEEGNVYKAWQNEADENGNIRRPWINQSDSRFEAATIEGRAVFSNPAFANKTFAEKLKEIDRRMGLQVHQPMGSNVLPAGNLTRGLKNSNVKITPYEERVAVMTKFGGSKAKSDADHIEAWKQAKIKHSAGSATQRSR